MSTQKGKAGAAPGKGKPGGVTGSGFQPGQSGNPGGRPKGLAARARALVGEDGGKLLDFWLLIMWGKDVDIRRRFGMNRKSQIRLKDRLDAAAQLADRGFGRPVQAITGPGGAPLTFTLQLDTHDRG